jgi:hypothetical protein
VSCPPRGYCGIASEKSTVSCDYQLRAEWARTAFDAASALATGRLSNYGEGIVNAAAAVAPFA